MCGPLYSEGLSDDWALAVLPDGSRFNFVPRFRRSAQQSYVIDKQGVLFSIGPAGCEAGDASGGLPLALLAGQQAKDGDVLVEVGPVDAFAVTDQAPVEARGG